MANEDKATRYHRLRRRAGVAGAGAVALMLTGALMSGAAAWLRDIVREVSFGWVTATAMYAAALGIAIECVQLPFAFYQGVILERRYGLSTHTTGHWWLDRAKAFAIGLSFGAGAAVILWALIRWLPNFWWLLAAIVFAAIGVVLTHLAPVVLMPIFYECTPLERPALVERLVALGRRANAMVTGVYEWRLSDRTRKANAALAGLGRTRRILLSDTLLQEHSDDEIEVILAHELAHHVHHDIWTAMALESVLTLAGFLAADYALEVAGPLLDLSRKADLAGMPLVVLVVVGTSYAFAPVSHALSRLHERRADRFALEITGSAEAFMSAMKRLSAQNLADEEPSRVTEVLFHSHPAARARIAAARAWSASHGAGDGGPRRT